MFPPFISDAKDKHPTFTFSVIWSRMLPPFVSDAKEKHPTFIFSVMKTVTGPMTLKINAGCFSLGSEMSGGNISV